MKTWQLRRSKRYPPRLHTGDESPPSMAVEVESELQERLHRMHLHLEAPDHDTLAIKRVPATLRCYSKSRTNLLIKRSADGETCFVCVDEDLEYRGSDASLAEAFASGPTQQGWRILSFAGSLRGSLGLALEYALGILGSDDSAPPDLAMRPAGSSLLEACAVDLTKPALESPGNPTVFRDEELEQAASCVLTWQRRLLLIVGQPGVGKSNLLLGVARILALHGCNVFSVNAGVMAAAKLFDCEREQLLTSLLRAARDANAVLALEQAEWALAGSPRAGVLLKDALDQGTRLIATTTPEHASRFLVQPLGSALEVTNLAELCSGDTLRVLELLRPSLAKHHGVEICVDAEQAAVERSTPLDGAFPGKAIRLLDLAAARARLNSRACVQPIDIYIVASRLPENAM